MAQFIFVNILMVSLAAIIYVVVRTLPRIDDGTPGNKNVFEKWLTSELPERFDAIFNGFLMKLLRKLKVVLLKVDNYLSGHIKKIKPEGDTNGRSKAIDFKEITAEKNGVAKEENSDNNSG